MKLTAYEVKDPGNWMIRPASVQRDWMDEVPANHAYKCLPLTMANQAGWVIECPTRFTALWGGRHGGPGDILLDFEDDHYRNDIRAHFGNGVVTFNLPWLFQTDQEGIGLWVKGAPNHYKPLAHALEGLVEAWWCPFTFTMNWKLMAPNMTIEFQQGEPICFLAPHDMRLLSATDTEVRELRSVPKLQKQYSAWERSRGAYNLDPRRDPKDMQAHYHKGIDHSGGVAGLHFTGVSLDHFYNKYVATEDRPPAPKAEDPAPRPPQPRSRSRRRTT